MADVSKTAELIVKDLEGFYEETDAVMKEIIDEVTGEALIDLENNPNIPIRNARGVSYRVIGTKTVNGRLVRKRKRTNVGHYLKKFYKKTVAEGRGYKRNVIGNKKYQLTHLLEKGHKTSNGGMTRAFPHWSTAQQVIEQKMEEKIRTRL